MDTSSDSDSNSVVCPHFIGQAEEGELSDLDQDVSVTDNDKAISEEQNYRHHAWHTFLHGLDTHSGYEFCYFHCFHPFTAPKQQPVGKISLNLPTDDWLCCKRDSLNLTFVQGYTSRSSETGGLQRDQFVKLAKSHAKWYELHPNRSAGSVYFWHCDSGKLNSAYSRIGRGSGLTTLAPTSRTISPDTLRRWEKAVCESSYDCNQADGLGRCPSKVQQGMQSQLRVIQSENPKGKSAGKVGTATEEHSTL